MDLNNFYINFEKAALIFARFSGLFVFSPVYGGSQIPVRVKALLAIFMTLIVFPFAKGFVAYSAAPLMFGLLAVNEVIIGLLIGFMYALLLIIFQLSGQLFSFNMGFGIVNTFDPSSETQVSIAGQYLYLIALLVFLITNGHHTIIYALRESFKVLPHMHFSNASAVAYYNIAAVSQMFKVALIIAAPVLGTLLMVELSLGILTRVAPQMNIFMIGFSIKILVGFISILAFLPLFTKISANFMQGFYTTVLLMVKQI